MELALHLPLMEFGDEGQSFARITSAVDAARECGFAAGSANDHFLFQAPWLDGATACRMRSAGSGRRSRCDPALREVLAPMLRRDPDELRDHLGLEEEGRYPTYRGTDEVVHLSFEGGTTR